EERSDGIGPPLFCAATHVVSRGVALWMVLPLLHRFALHCNWTEDTDLYVRPRPPFRERLLGVVLRLPFFVAHKRFVGGIFDTTRSERVWNPHCFNEVLWAAGSLCFVFELLLRVVILQHPCLDFVLLLYAIVYLWRKNDGYTQLFWNGLAMELAANNSAGSFVLLLLQPENKEQRRARTREDAKSRDQ
ncbi:unnamed protein product, partial [Amoebophrya sp. A120]